MLRTTLLAISILLTGIGLLCFVTSGGHLWRPLIWVTVLLALILGERWRYSKKKFTGGEGWKQTDEQFIDPETGKSVRVFYNASTGERHYESQE